MEDVYDVGRYMGTFINLVNSGRAESQNPALSLEEWRKDLSLRHLCTDALTVLTQDSVVFVPKHAYCDDTRTSEDGAIKELGEMLAKLSAELDPQNMRYDPTNNHCDLDRPNVPSREERFEKLTRLDIMIHKIRATLIFLSRQLGQLLVARHKYGHRVGRIPQIVALERLICTTGFTPDPWTKVVDIEATPPIRE